MSEPKVERINGILCLCWHGDNIPLRYIGSCLGEMVLERDAEIERLQKIAAMIECPRCGYKPKAAGGDDE